MTEADFIAAACEATVNPVRFGFQSGVDGVIHHEMRAVVFEAFWGNANRIIDRDVLDEIDLA